MTGLIFQDRRSRKDGAMKAGGSRLAHLLTIAEYAALGEDEYGRTELTEGRVVLSSSPTPDHMVSIAHLAMQRTPEVPDALEVIPDVDIDLALVPADQPGSSRRPDLFVVRRTARQRVRAE